MNLDAVHEPFSEQALVEGILEEKGSVPDYEELFPSLPDNEAEIHPAQPDMGQWQQRMKVRSSIITQVYRVPVEERKFKSGDPNTQRFGEQGMQARVCTDIMQATGAHIEISSSKDQSLTILVTGKEEAVLKARRLILKELQTQAVVSISIPKEHHRFILGKNGKRLTDLELNTATKITVPRPDERSDIIKITGTKEGIEKARHEIQVASDEQAKKAFERLHIPKVYHPFIFGPFNETVNKIINETGARINIPPPSVMKDELTIAGEKEPVAKAKEMVMKIYDECDRNFTTISVEVPKNQHKYIIGHRGHTIQEILQETGVSVEIPSTDLQSDTITLRGEQIKIGPALTLVYAKANSVKTEHVDVPSWLHKYIIGKKGANIKNLTQDLMKIQVDFKNDSIKIEGPPEEVKQACDKLKEMTADIRKQVAVEEIRINPEFHRHIVGKNGSNISRLKGESKAIINIPQEQDRDNDLVRIEGPPEGVAEIKREIMEMVQKMKNEVTQEVRVDQRYHRNIIGAKGEKIREIREKFNQVNINFPEPGLKSDKISIRGPKADVDACHKYMKKMNEDIMINNHSVDVPIYKQNHKFIIGKGGANIKKIREETNTRIDLPAEGSDSDVITIRGKKEDVLKAKGKILEIQESLGNITTMEIIIPNNLHNTIIGLKGKGIRSISEDCGGVNIKFPSAESGSDKVSIRGVKEDVNKAKKLLLEISNEKQLTGFTAELQARPEHHKFLIGKGGSNIRKIRDNTGARIVFPNDRDEDRETITIIGRKEQVEAAKKELSAIIDSLKDIEILVMNIDPKHHKHFVFRRGENLKEISEDFGGVTVSFPKKNESSSEVTLKGAKNFLEGAKKRLLEIVKELDERVTTECFILQEHHRTVLGSKGSKVQSIEQDFNVSIKFPDRNLRDRNEDESNEVTMNGNYLENDESSPRNRIIITGKPDNCVAAAKALQDSVPVAEEVEIPYDLHRFIIGQKGNDVRYLMNQFDVRIDVPPQNEHSDIIVIKGPPANIQKAKEALTEKVKELEKEKEDRLLRSFSITLEVDPEHHPKIIGRKGAVVNKIRQDYDVIINFPERNEENEKLITISGYEKNAVEAKEAILKIVKEQEDMFKEEVSIDSRIHPRIIGARGRNVSKIMDQYKVQIRFPRPNDPDPNIVTIQGNEDDVLDAKDYLLNMEEEFLQDMTERDFMRQYTQPPSRNGGIDGVGGPNNKGFVVKGAPWEKNQAPDTSNTQEFPSFGSGGDVAPRAPIAWGPTRR